MVDAIINFIAFMITIPIIATLLVYLLSKKMVRHKGKAFHLAVNLTTILYIFASIILLYIIFESYFIGIILVCFIGTLAIIITFQWRTTTEIIFIRAIKISWRICFLAFFIMYICLVVYGIIERILFH